MPKLVLQLTFAFILSNSKIYFWGFGHKITKFPHCELLGKPLPSSFSGHRKRGEFQPLALRLASSSSKYSRVRIRGSESRRGEAKRGSASQIVKIHEKSTGRIN